jgi:hypothetical protein
MMDHKLIDTLRNQGTLKRTEKRWSIRKDSYVWGFMSLLMKLKETYMENSPLGFKK